MTATTSRTRPPRVGRACKQATPRRSRPNGARCSAVAALLLSAVVLAGVPPAGAESPTPLPVGQSASDTIDDLESQGYNVEINWVTGFDTKPLSECRVTSINNPGDETPGDGRFVTVYVDVACPNGDDSGFGFGIGIG